MKELYAELIALPPEQRSGVLLNRCDDALVCAEVERLLLVDISADQHLDRLTRHVDSVLASARYDVESYVGRRVGPYEVLRVIGQGGMGVVYLAHDTLLSRKAALKMVLPGDGQNSMLADRLRREARVLASLSHPNVATVYGLEEFEGQLFIALEYIEGKSLAQRLSRGALPLAETLQYCEQIAAGLGAVHDKGVIHRDLKPGNAMLTADGAVKVLDFGLSRVLSDSLLRSSSETAEPTLTSEGSVFGTPAYMSPEQARGEPLDQRSDIYSFGSILFRCVAGRTPFEGESNQQLIDAIISGDPDWSKLPAKLAAPIESIIRRCLQKDPHERYQHIGDVRLDLREARMTRVWEKSVEAPIARRSLYRAIPWLVAASAIAVTGASFLASPVTTSKSVSHRFDVAFPEDLAQSDLERAGLALSPDGSSIVVAAKTDGGQSLWIRRHTDGIWQRIDRTEGGQRPFFSPDGTWITYFKAAHLYKQRPGGQGDPIRLVPATNWYGATWADDGSLIFSQAWGDPLQALSPDGTSRRTCTALDSSRKESAHITPTAVPGGRWVLYNAWTGGESTDLRAVNLDSGADHVVINNASTARVASTPRGDYLLFERASIIFAAPFDRKEARVTGGESAIAEGVMNDGTRFVAYFDAASDGTLAYFPGAAFAEESRLSYINADGTTEPFNDDRLSFCEPIYSAAAKKVGALIKGKVYRAVMYDLAGAPREFVLTGGDTISMAISPDGQSMVCTVNRDGGYGIDRFSIDDGRYVERILKPGADYPSDLTYAPDGKRLAFSTRPVEGVPSDIWLIEPVAGSQPNAIVHTAGADTKPSIRADMKWMAYQSDVSGRAEIYLVSYPDGATTRQITSDGGTNPVWSPDGSKLYFVSPTHALMSIEISPTGTATGKPSVVYSKLFGQSDPIAREYTIAPDGRPLIVEPSERRPAVPHLHVITNWYNLLP